jgi:hypothetical protein
MTILEFSHPTKTARKTSPPQAPALSPESWTASQAERPTPLFTWEQVERQLADLSGSPERAALAPALVSAVRKQSRFKPPEVVLREIFCLAWTLMDESFQPGPLPGERVEMP